MLGSAGARLEPFTPDSWSSVFSCLICYFISQPQITRHCWPFSLCWLMETSHGKFVGSSAPVKAVAPNFIGNHCQDCLRTFLIKLWKVITLIRSWFLHTHLFKCVIIMHKTLLLHTEVQWLFKKGTWALFQL